MDEAVNARLKGLLKPNVRGAVTRLISQSVLVKERER